VLQTSQTARFPCICVFFGTVRWTISEACSAGYFPCCQIEWTGSEVIAGAPSAAQQCCRRALCTGSDRWTAAAQYAASKLIAPSAVKITASLEHIAIARSKTILQCRFSQRRPTAPSCRKLAAPRGLRSRLYVSARWRQLVHPCADKSS
jgi:hypothetical protein